MDHSRTAAFTDIPPGRTPFGPGEPPPVNRVNRSSAAAPPPVVAGWPAVFSSILATLRQLATTTEHDFLQIGSQMQGIYQRSIVLARTAHQLVEVASGERIRGLMDRLRQILGEMESYFAKAREQNINSCTTLGNVGTLLRQVAEPLSGFKKMSMQLYILEVSVKIESTSLEEMEGEFLNLAQDIKKLSRQIKVKANMVHDHRQSLSSMISESIADLQTAQKNQDTSVRVIAGETRASLLQLETVNERFTALGAMISSVSEENSNTISDIVQSMQIHDMYRQQVEHVIEALAGLQPVPPGSHHQNEAGSDLDCQKLISKTGDICELQEAQLQFAATEFDTAVSSIMSNLRGLGTKQKQMGQEISSKMGGISTSNISFIDDVRQHMSSITTLLATCADTNKELSGITKKVTGAVYEITGFVSDIEEIGHEITQIALNSRIKAAGTGEKGASLCALSEEIGQLANEAMQRADSIITSLKEIQSATTMLAAETDSNEKTLDSSLSGMNEELSETLSIFDAMGTELFALLPQLQREVNSLTGEIEEIIGGIDVHERARVLGDTALDNLRQIFHQARQLYPASAAFKDDIRRIARRYTMESERRIHEAIAKKHGVKVVMAQSRTDSAPDSSESELGDNVELF